jgi:hypothetical protein
MRSCPSCDRHVFDGTTTCPFCQAPCGTTRAGLLVTLGLTLGIAFTACGEPQSMSGLTDSDGSSSSTNATTTITTTEPTTNDASTSDASTSGASTSDTSASDTSTSDTSTDADEPAWWTQLPVGQWHEVPGTRITDTHSSAGPISAGIFHDYSGVALKRDDSTVIAFGGGHGGSSDNSVVALRLSDESPQWVVWVEPTPEAERVIAHSDDPMPPLWWGPIGMQKPNPWHTYNGAQFSTGLGRAMWYGDFGPWNYSGNPPGYNQVFSILWSEHRWAQPNTPEALGTPDVVSRVTAQDDNGMIYLTAGETIYRHDPMTDSYSIVADDASLHWANYGAMAFDSQRQRLFRFGDAYADASGNPRVIELTGSVSTPTFTGDPATITALQELAAQDTLGMTYDPVGDRFVLPLGEGGAFYAIDAGSFAVSVVNPGGDVPMNKHHPSAGIYGRIHFLPQLRGLVYLPNADGNVCVLRL